MIPQTPRRWWPLAAVVTLLVAAVLSAAHATPQLDRVPRLAAPTEVGPTLDATEAPAEKAAPPAAAGGIDMPDWLVTAFGVLLLLFVAAALALAVWWLVGRVLRRDRRAARAAGVGPTGLSAREADAEILAAVDAGLAELSDTDADPRRAVIACWLRLEEAASAAGVPRQPTDTATDLVVRLLGGAGAGVPGGVSDTAGVPGGVSDTAGVPGGVSGAGVAGGGPGRPQGRVVSADVLAGFADVYREARYARHRIDVAMRDQARAALHRLRAELTAAVPG